MRQIAEWARLLPAWAEFGAVATIGFGWFIGVSLWNSILGEFQTQTIGVSHLYWLIAQELAFGGPLALLLAWRGWTGQTLGLAKPRISDALVAAGLFILVYVLSLVAAVMALQVLPDHGPPFSFMERPSVALLIVVSLLNSLYEEVLVCAYVIERFAKCRWRWLGLAISFVLRLSYHVYQGPMGLMQIAIVGIVFGAWYRYRRRLWPLVGVHAAIDLIGLSYLVR